MRVEGSINEIAASKHQLGPHKNSKEPESIK
jgi:hypothetical protein